MKSDRFRPGRRALFKGMAIAGSVVATPEWARAAILGNIFTGVASEVTQIANFGELLSIAASDATTALYQYYSYLKQVEQWKMEFANFLKLEVLPDNIQSALKAYNSIMEMKGALESLGMSVDQQKDVFDTRFLEANLLGKTWGDYTKGVEAQIKAKNKSAMARLDFEKGIIDRVQDDYEYVQKLQAELPAASGVNQMLQTLNQTMGRVVLQNAKLQEAYAQITVRDSADSQSERAIGQERRRLESEYLRKAQEALQARQRKWAESL